MAESTTPVREMRTFAAGDVVMKQDEMARGLFLLMAGTLEVVFDGVRVAEISEKGAFVGEIASLLGGRRIAMVRAVTPAKLMLIRDVTNYFEENPSAAFMVAKTLATRVMRMNERMATYEKIARELMGICEDVVASDNLGPLKGALSELRSRMAEGVGAG